MKINTYIASIGAFWLLLILGGCDSFLDPDKDGKMTEADVWNDTRRAFGYFNNAYNYLPGGYNRISNALLAAGCDEAVHSVLSSNVKTFNDGTWGPYRLVDHTWKNNYEGIHIANYFLEKADDITLPTLPTISGTNDELLRTRERMKGEAHFLRAYFYTELLKRYGGVPLITHALTTEEARKAERASFDECIEQILADCDEAAERLPEVYAGTQGLEGFDDKKEVGRPTVGAAYALKCRALLYWASPLNNPGKELSRYKQAADAAELAMQTRANYALQSFEGGKSYTDLFVSGNLPQYNPEIIFSTKYTAGVGVERNNSPISMGGRGYTGPTQNLADAFGMANGKPITDPASGYDPQNPYEGRDPRFYLTFAHNGMSFKMNGRTEQIETFEGGKDAVGSYKDASRTGYYLNKFLSGEAIWDGSTNNVTRTWILMRHAELLLNYAEALNEYHASPVEEVYKAVEDIRKRAGLNPYGLSRDMSREAMRELIRNERRVELAFEEHRLYDIRRWKLFDDPQEKKKMLDIRGMRIVPLGGDDYRYEEYTVENRTFEDKMYRYPISQNEILKAPGIEQNPDW